MFQKNYKLHSLEWPLLVSKDPSYSSISQEGELLGESDRMDSKPGSVAEWLGDLGQAAN